MRTIKFRGKLKQGEWVYGSLLQDDYGNCYIVEFADHREQLHNVESYTIGQFTGLYDKNENEIYDGDIIKYIRINIYNPYSKFHNQDIISFHLIKWNNDKYSFIQEYYNIERKQIGGGNINFYDDRATNNIIEVIGNIYDNPELIKYQEHK